MSVSATTKLDIGGHAGSLTAPLAPRMALREASARYLTAPHFFRWYVWFKYRLDPCYLAVAAQIPTRTLTLDLGTGLGMLPVLLGLLGGEREILGIDHDRTKIGVARQVSRGLAGVQISENDFLNCDFPRCDVVTLIDVLHYHSAAAQRELLERAAKALRPGGRLLIRDADRREKGGARWTRALERLAVWFGWNRAGRVLYRPIVEIEADLARLGFKTNQTRVAGSLYPGNVLLVAELRT
ncbi:MAG: methyltransferase domain-containing protein [Nevskiales bacterium]